MITEKLYNYSSIDSTVVEIDHDLATGGKARACLAMLAQRNYGVETLLHLPNKVDIAHGRTLALTISRGFVGLFELRGKLFSLCPSILKFHLQCFFSMDAARWRRQIQRQPDALKHVQIYH